MMPHDPIGNLYELSQSIVQRLCVYKWHEPRIFPCDLYPEKIQRVAPVHKQLVWVWAMYWRLGELTPLTFLLSLAQNCHLNRAKIYTQISSRERFYGQVSNTMSAKFRAPGTSCVADIFGSRLYSVDNQNQDMRSQWARYYSPEISLKAAWMILQTDGIKVYQNEQANKDTSVKILVSKTGLLSLKFANLL